MAGSCALGVNPEPRFRRAYMRGWLCTLSALPVFLALPAAQAAAGPYGIFSTGDGAAAGFGTVGGVGQVSWAQDWSTITTTPSQKHPRDWFSRLKHVSLTDKGDIWISFFGEERLRYIFENQPLMGTAGKTDASRLLLRSQYGADLHIGKHVRVYAELLQALAGGSNYYGYQTGIQRERLDLQQGILEIRGTVLGTKAGVIGGRQVFLDAPVSMQSARDLTNAQQTWDGVRGYAIWKRTRLDLFDFAQTNKLPVGIFSDGTNYAARMFGGYSSTALPGFGLWGKPGQLFADLFYIGYLFSGPLAAQPLLAQGRTQAGSTRRDNVGARLWGKAGPIAINLTGVFQGGQYRPVDRTLPNRAVRAYAVNAAVLYAASARAWKPSLGVQADLFSGGSYRTQGEAVGTFATPYFPLPYYNDVTLSLTSQNLVGAGPLLDLAPSSTFHIKLHLPFFWRESTNDAVYAVGKTYSWRDRLSGGYTGTIPQAQAAWNFAPHWTWTQDFAGFSASHAMLRAGARSGVFIMQTMMLKF